MVTDIFHMRMSLGLSNLRRDQILPMIGQGYIYFGAVFSPIFTVIIARIGILFDSLYIKSKKLEIYFIASLVSFYLSQGMILNFIIIMNKVSYILAFYLPIVYLGYLVEKSIINKRRVLYK